MIRRSFIGAGLGLAATAGLPVRADARAAADYVKPGAQGWPDPAAWARLSQDVSGRLRPVSLPDLGDPAVRRLVSDPFYVSSQPGLTQSSGWLDAWRSSPSAYAVAAESAADVAAAIRFARAHNVRLVVKGAGHSYLGASNAPDSLLVWTRPMGAVEVHDAFAPRGSTAEPVPAVSVGGGGIWLHAYQAVTGGAGRYVQGGGGGTYGVVTRLTLATHPLPATFGALRLSIKATSDEAFHRLLARFVAFYAQSLCNPHWGESVTAQADNRLDVQMVFQGLSQGEARAVWKPLIDFADANHADYQGQESMLALALPARRFWDAEFLRRNMAPAVRFDTRPGASPDDFWWAGDGGQVGVFWHAYESAWLPASLLKPQNQARLANAWFAASRHWSVAFHFNKGLAGAPAAAIEAARDTATNPEVLDAFALAIVASGGGPAFPGFPKPNLGLATVTRDAARASMTALRAAAPGAGAYVNECSYFQQNWREAFWGEHYARLARVKRRYDPAGVFTVHHGVGSEA